MDDVLDLSTALDLADAKSELLSEYKLEHPVPRPRRDCLQRPDEAVVGRRELRQAHPAKSAAPLTMTLARR